MTNSQFPGRSRPKFHDGWDATGYYSTNGYIAILFTRAQKIILPATFMPNWNAPSICQFF